MKIGIDIDGVLTNAEQFDTDYCTKYCFENNIEYNIGESDYHIYKRFNITEEQEDGFVDKYSGYYAVNEKARPFAAEVIKKLKDEGHEIYIITARCLICNDDEAVKKMMEIVKNWLLENEIMYDKLIFSRASKERKVPEIVENKIELMIEDNPNNVNELSKLIPVICYDTSYNKECMGDKITRCYSWYDIYKNIKIMEKKQ